MHLILVLCNATHSHTQGNILGSHSIISVPYTEEPFKLLDIYMTGKTFVLLLWIEMNISIINYLSKNDITPPLHDDIMVVAADL